ncbi:hypothetical protein [Variovorax sp. RO1]|uniref:hypothetical protein n=1 Tax=Variovorax sp. RO1 TaxID=2066034 RepID=UPI00117FAAE4|nr:hypothetical protein [Variovorax sp. RO1]
MWINRILILGSLLIGAALPVQAADEGTGTSPASPIGAEAMARMRELRPGEYFAKTREGCRVITDEPHPSRKEAITAAWARFTWEGVCSEGTALGPGTLIARSGNGETIYITEGWQLYGRWIGLSVVTFLYPGASGSKTEVFYWDGEGYGRGVPRPDSSEARKEPHMPSVSYLARDRSKRIYYSIKGSCGANAQPCVSEWKPPYPPVADPSAGRTEFYCNGSCVNLWVEKAAPLIAALDTFAKTHAADVTAVKQALEPLLVQRRREAVEAEAQARRDAAEAEVQAKRKAIEAEAEARRKAAQAELVAQAEVQRKREEAARAEQQFRTSLQTLNPGQLFARADELNAQGDSARAREVQRALMSRFPNHPLAATAARQMAGESATSPASAEPSREADRSTASTTASQVSLADCAPERDAVVARWRANDSTEENIKRQLANVLADVNSADRARAMKNLEQYQQIALKGSTPYPPLVFSVCMLKVRLARLAAAPSVAGDTGGGLASTAVATNPGARGRLSSQTCEAMKQTVMTTKVPPNASVTASTETVMFMTKTVLDMIAGGCPTDSSTPAQIEAERQERQRQYTAAESACNAVQSGGRRCVPRVHTAAEASRPTVSSAAQNTQQQGAISYDPVTGRCLGEGCCSLPGITGQPQCSSSSRSSGGGIRTAR